MSWAESEVVELLLPMAIVIVVDSTVVHRRAFEIENIFWDKSSPCARTLPRYWNRLLGGADVWCFRRRCHRVEPGGQPSRWENRWRNYLQTLVTSLLREGKTLESGCWVLNYCSQWYQWEEDGGWREMWWADADVVMSIVYLMRVCVMRVTLFVCMFFSFSFFLSGDLNYSSRSDSGSKLSS